MNMRTIKRRIYRLFHSRFNSRTIVWGSVGNRAWLDMEPVGIEFGSPDYQRLEKEQLEDWELNALADAREGQPTTKVNFADL